MSQYEGASFLSKSTFLRPHSVDNLTDMQKLFEEWLHSHNSDDIQRYKSLMMPPKIEIKCFSMTPATTGRKKQDCRIWFERQ
jgi:hypothetical protein